jgi:hypothetical protein
MSILNNASGKYFKWTGTDLLINAGNFGVDSAGNITANGGTIAGWTINPTTLQGGQTLLQSDGVIRLRDANGVTKVSLNYDTTSTTDPLNSAPGTVPLTGISAGTAHFETGSLSGQGASGYLQVPGAGTAPYAPTWNVYSNFTVPLTAAYEFTLSIPTTSLLKATALPDTGPEFFPGPYVALRLYVYGPGGVNMYEEEYVSGLVESVTGNAYGTEGFPSSPANVFYMNGLNLVAGVTYSFLLQYIVFNVDYNNVLDINYYIPNTLVSYNAAVASSNMNQSGLTLGQDTDRYIFTKPGTFDLFLTNEALYNGLPNPFPGNDSAQNRKVIGEIGGAFLLLNSDSKGHLSNNQRIYINQASFPRSNRGAGGSFITSYFFGGWNRAFQTVRAFGFFEPDSSTNHTIYSTVWWPFSYNIETVTYVGSKTFDITFVEPIYSSESWDTQGISNPANTNKLSYYTVEVGWQGPTCPKVVSITNLKYTGFRLILDSEATDGSRLSIAVHK